MSALANIQWTVRRRINNLKRKALTPLYQKVLPDRRCKFYDLSLIEPENRKAQSPVIQFYSSVDNIGNYLPVLGIHKMLSQTTDTCCAHSKQIDFDFINSHYKCAIIGGAGLLHKSFTPFWQKLLNECKLPMIIWGVGICLPDGKGSYGADRDVVAEVAKRCALVNVRDDLTADYYAFKSADISACPTIVYLDKFRQFIRENNKQVLFSSHEELVEGKEKLELIKTVLRLTPFQFQYTDNVQYPFLGLDDLIAGSYSHSRLVVTTRLHGAIIAYGLGIPYIAIPRDEKLRAFYRIYANGISVKNASELEETLRNGKLPAMKPVQMSPVLNFGERAKNWVMSCC